MWHGNAIFSSAKKYKFYYFSKKLRRRPCSLRLKSYVNKFLCLININLHKAKPDGLTL